MNSSEYAPDNSRRDAMQVFIDWGNDLFVADPAFAEIMISSVIDDYIDRVNTLDKTE